MSTKTSKEAALRSFRAITNASTADATRLLKNNSYRVEAAVDDFYNDPVAISNAAKAGSSSSMEKKKVKEATEKLGKLFDDYKEEGADEMDIEGTQEYFAHLGLDLEDVVVLALCFYLKAPAMGKFKRADFIKGWLLLDKAATIEAQKQVLVGLRKDFQEDRRVRTEAGSSVNNVANGSPSESGGLYTKTYEFTYGFARREGQKSLDLETAIAFWDLIIPHAPTFAKSDGSSNGSFTQGQLEMWKRYLKEKTDGRAVSKDTWALFLEFTKEIDQDFKNHDEDGAWPSVIDDFVYWARDEIAAGRGPNAMEED
ncbi:defective in cullin neddylation protein 1 [Tilletiaria anomala UBC 951]|uniref:Defective in cullin neddylation protein n=1 Tax=Tilletiaria anomala (strain ATCC 24038 / CBS 436.72 / UBC 951) TaxID=1037660 RepID=A0A066VZG0_TILAU|nr:defective in cullin neddylation protein 1 [Tilletiaria anomala UBC 951]KDN43900.1 defective in cullin neddylation protein 1 [Tilletiaria anomala UBC 951]